jgi:hypothetical protein
MPFENLVVARVVLHEVFKRRHDGALVPPHYGTQLIALPPEAMDIRPRYFRRLRSALTTRSGCSAFSIETSDIL